MSDDVTLYHWAPRERHGQILRRGLVPGCGAKADQRTMTASTRATA